MFRELEDFLFATIGEEANGMQLSVVSALARLGVDPWAEAIRLACMPRLGAARRLAPMIARLPGSAWAPPDSERIAARLVELLPPPAGPTVPSASTVPVVRSQPNVLWTIGLVCVITMAVVFAIRAESSFTRSSTAEPAIGQGETRSDRR